MAAEARKSLAERLKSGLEEGIAHTQDELTLKTVEVPVPPAEIDAKTLAAVREVEKKGGRVTTILMHIVSGNYVHLFYLTICVADTTGRK